MPPRPLKPLQRRHWLLAGLALAGCAADPRAARDADSPEQRAQRDCEAALQQYVQRLRAQDARGLAALFLPNGKLEQAGQPPVAGRAQIEQFLQSMAAYRVLSHDMRVMRTAAAPSHVSQTGTFVQTVRDPAGQTATVRGWFVLQWDRQPDGHWLLEYARTSSTAPAGS